MRKGVKDLLLGVPTCGPLYTLFGDPIGVPTCGQLYTLFGDPIGVPVKLVFSALLFIIYTTYIFYIIFYI
jgi:hypothetical protein